MYQSTMLLVAFVKKGLDSDMAKDHGYCAFLMLQTLECGLLSTWIRRKRWSSLALASSNIVHSILVEPALFDFM